MSIYEDACIMHVYKFVYLYTHFTVKIKSCVLFCSKDAVKGNAAYRNAAKRNGHTLNSARKKRRRGTPKRCAGYPLLLGGVGGRSQSWERTDNNIGVPQYWHKCR